MAAVCFVVRSPSVLVQHTNHYFSLNLTSIVLAKVAVFDTKVKRVYLMLSLWLGLAVISRQNFSLLIVNEVCNLLVIVNLLLAMPTITHIIHSSIKIAFPACFPPRTTSAFTLTLPLDWQIDFIDRRDHLVCCACAVQWNVSETFYVRTSEPSLLTNN